MRMHLAERDPQHHAWPKRGVEAGGLRLRILLSYWYYKDANLDDLFKRYLTEPYPEVFADSGGFSAYTQGAIIDVCDYAAWLKRWHHLLSAKANLDVIGDAQATRDNQAKLEAMGLSVLPVFHVGEPVTYLEQYIADYPYIALGGMVPYMKTPQRIMPWIIRAFKMAKGKSVFHGFGATAWKVIRDLPWYSVDSSSWGQGFRFGVVPVFDSRLGKFHKAKLGDVSQWAQIAALVRGMGFDPMDFADRDRNDRSKICAISALSYMLAEQWLRKRHGEIRIPQREHMPSGPRAYLADANPARFGDAVSGMPGGKVYLFDTSNGVNYGDADRGLKLHLADARQSSAGEITSAQAGLKLHLAEHSLDRGGVGDTSRAIEVLLK